MGAFECLAEHPQADIPEEEPKQVRTRILVGIAAVLALLGISLVIPTATASPAELSETVQTVASGRANPAPAPAELTKEQRQELDGFAEEGLDMYYSADKGGWVTARTFVDKSGNKITFKDSANLGSLILTDVSLAPKDGRDFWCGDNGKNWTVQNFLREALSERADVESGFAATRDNPSLPGSREIIGGKAWCFIGAA